MKKTLVFIFILTIGFTNCSKNNNKIEQNDTFRDIFTKSEINDLQLLFDFFNESIRNDFNCDDLTSCYDSLFKEIEKGQMTGTFKPEISFDEQREVYNKFNDSTFYKIYDSSRNKRTEYSENTFRTLYIFRNGKYMNFLKELGKENETLNSYYKCVQVSGDVPHLFLLKRYLIDENFDLTDIRVQFIVAINFLSINDYYNRGK